MLKGITGGGTPREADAATNFERRSVLVYNAAALPAVFNLGPWEMGDLAASFLFLYCSGSMERQDQILIHD
jgi:hypothetical protein